MLWEYKMMPNNLTKHMPFSPVYGTKVVVLAKFVIPNLFIAKTTRMLEEVSIQSCMTKIMGLEGDHFLLQCHQTVEKAYKKAWHDHHIKNKSFGKGDYYCSTIINTSSILTS